MIYFRVPFTDADIYQFECLELEHTVCHLVYFNMLFIAEEDVDYVYRNKP